MSEDKKPNHHATAWIVTLIALPVLYVLSWGPVEAMYYTGRIPETALPWMEKFYQPVYWLNEKKPLKEPLHSYMRWWGKVLYKSRNPAVTK